MLIDIQILQYTFFCAITVLLFILTLPRACLHNYKSTEADFNQFNLATFTIQKDYIIGSQSL